MIKEIEILHSCGHAAVHRAWGKRIRWLETVPCPVCAAITPKPAVAPQNDGDRQREVMRLYLEENMPAGWVKEYRFDPVRRWRFDYAWPEPRFALEVDGFGRHTMPKGAIADDEKFASAAVQGWLVLRAHWHHSSLVFVLGALITITNHRLQLIARNQ